jgi:uncharacterized protein (TIGR00251 family)
MLTITPHAEGCLLGVRAQPGARKNAVLGEHAGMLKIAVTAPSRDGRANQGITELLREWLGLKRSQVELATGAASRQKQFLIRDIDVARLTKLMATPAGLSGPGAPGKQFNG